MRKNVNFYCFFVTENHGNEKEKRGDNDQDNDDHMHDEIFITNIFCLDAFYVNIHMAFKSDKCMVTN